jgi:hypothetical protein
LEILISEYEPRECSEMLRNPDERAAASAVLAPRLVAGGMLPGTLDTTAGDNLFRAILSLRIKFPADEARQKVELNIAMREGRV